MIPGKLGQNDPRELERRMLMDTYTTFGCEDGKPTFQYSLLHGVRDGYLVNPVVADARTEITTQLLSDEGYSVITTSEDGEETEISFLKKILKRRFFLKTPTEVFVKLF